MKYRFIIEQLKEYPKGICCRILGVSRSGCYHWHRRRLLHRSLAETELLLKIKKHYQLSRGRYGLLRLTSSIRKEGMIVNKKRVYRIMKKYGIYSKTKKKFRVTTKQNHKASFSSNLLNGKFEAVKVNQIWTSDITYIWTNQGWLYLAVILDVYNREIIGWSLNHRCSVELVLKALTMAINNRRAEPSIIFHSDRGSQYTSSRFRNTLAYYGFTQSMSGKGNCYDNAITESFFSTLKKELIYLTKFETKEQAAVDVFEFIEIFYNRKRLHSALGYESPLEFKLKEKLKNKKEEILINNINKRVAYLCV
ncbi:MAG: IS3 family transposase [Ignavibacteriota bacterium]|nr:MAG: IS3 family transposase [Ignavibacteriota bacterium]